MSTHTTIRIGQVVAFRMGRDQVTGVVRGPAYVPGTVHVATIWGRIYRVPVASLIVQG